MLTILSGIRTIHQVGVSVGESVLAEDMEAITAVGMTHGTLTAGEDTPIMADIMAGVTPTMEVITVVVTTVVVTTTMELLITAIVITEDKTIPGLEDRML